MIDGSTVIDRPAMIDGSTGGGVIDGSTGRGGVIDRASIKIGRGFVITLKKVTTSTNCNFLSLFPTLYFVNLVMKMKTYFYSYVITLKKVTTSTNYNFLILFSTFLFYKFSDGNFLYRAFFYFLLIDVASFFPGDWKCRDYTGRV